MEGLELRYNTLIKAYNRLKNVIKAYDNIAKISPYNLNQEQNSSEEPKHLIYRDALIQRFEICYDLTWKFWKTYLKANHSLEDSAKSRKVFQECFQQRLINEEETKQFFKMTEARNNTSHEYDEISADEIAQQIPTYYDLMIKTLERNFPKGDKR